MAFVASSQTRLITGVFPLSAYTTTVSPATARAMIRRTSLADTAEVYMPGIRSATLTVDTMVDADTTAGAYWSTVTGFYAGSTAIPVTIAPNGISAGSEAWLASALPTTMSLGSTVTDGVNAALTFTPTGAVGYGQNLLSHDAVGATANGAAVDGGAATSNGGIAHLHVTAASGTTPTLDVTIEHSVNGSSSWSTLATFTQVTTSTASERVVVAAGTSVRRYLRAVVTIAGTSPSYTVAVAFARS